MTSAGQFSSELPDGITVLDMGPFLVEFASSGKIILLAKADRGKHLTINYGGRSGVLDAHLTDPGAAERHTSLGGVRASEIVRLLETGAPSVERNLRLLASRTVRRVRFGWLSHRDILVLPFGPDARDLAALGIRRGKRLLFDEPRLLAHFGRKLDKAAIIQSSALAFWLYRPASGLDQPYGALFKHTDDSNRIWFYWFRSTRVISELRKLWRVLEPDIRKLLLTPSETSEAIARARGTANSSQM